MMFDGSRGYSNFQLQVNSNTLSAAFEIHVYLACKSFGTETGSGASKQAGSFYTIA